MSWKRGGIERQAGWDGGLRHSLNPCSGVDLLHGTQPRLRCRCFADLTKPSQRLQRLIHSAPAEAGHLRGSLNAQEVPTPALRGEGQLTESSNISPKQAKEHLRELTLLVGLLPGHLRESLCLNPKFSQLVEVVLDLGRPPYARLTDGDLRLADEPVTQADLDFAIQQVGEFGDDNRAGIDRTLHRISCMRNRDGVIVGLTCRAGRAVTGSASLAADLATAGLSILILGRPGVGKTTAIRELARLLADECHRRVVICDTSNEIGGDGDIPHHGVGTARRMQVARTGEQHRVMIEAVENHMPEVIVIDEIGTEAEALAARTIAQRGVQLIATAHGGHLENLLKNPSLTDLLGGIQTVTLGDEEARRRGGRKSVQERAAPPTFDVAIELLERRRWRIYTHLDAAVDRILLGADPRGEVREQDASGRVTRAASIYAPPAEQVPPISQAQSLGMHMARGEGMPHTHPTQRLQGNTHILAEGSGQWQGVSVGESVVQPLFVYEVGLGEESVQDAVHALGQRGERLILTTRLEAADVVLALRSQMKSGAWARTAAKAAGVPVYAVRNGGASHLLRALETLLGLQPSAGGLFDSGSSSDDETVEVRSHVVSMSAAHNQGEALEEARLAVEQIVLPTLQPIELLPRNKDIIMAQAGMIHDTYGLATETIGSGLSSRLRITPHARVDVASTGSGKMGDFLAF